MNFLFLTPRPPKKKVLGKMLHNKVRKVQSPWHITPSCSEVQSGGKNLPVATSGPSDVSELRSCTWQRHMVNIQMGQLSDFIYCPFKNILSVLCRCILLSCF